MTPIPDEEAMVLHAQIEMDQQGTPTEEVDAVIDMLRLLVGWEKRKVYRLLVALLHLMRGCEHHRTGILLDQARAAFFQEGQQK